MPYSNNSQNIVVVLEHKNYFTLANIISIVLNIIERRFSNAKDYIEDN